MLLKKILFGLVWVVFLPFLFVYFFVKNPFSVFWKIGWIRQSVYEKMVLRKEEVMQDYKINPKHPEPKWEKERRELRKLAIQKFAIHKEFKNRKRP